jgi:hypothetical protein
MRETRRGKKIKTLRGKRETLLRKNKNGRAS